MKVMNKWKIAFLIVVPLQIVFALYLAFIVVDMSITHNYMTEGYADSDKTLERANYMLKGRINKKDALYLLRQKEPDSFIAEENDSISVSTSKFLFDEKGMYSGSTPPYN